MITNDDIPLTPDEYEFDWEVIEIYNVTRVGHEKRGVLVRYTPCNEIADCSVIEKFVPVPWHKCTSAEHAIQVRNQKIVAYAPRNEWAREITPPPADKSNEILRELDNDSRKTGAVRDGKPVDDQSSRGEIADRVSEAPDEPTG